MTIDSALEYWLGKPVPRYTSYPPATSFTDGVGTNQYRRALSDLAPHTRLSLYLHIPFCQSLCLYCGCNTEVTHRRDRIAAYLAALRQEIITVAKFLPPDIRIVSLHWGGGTPNMLSNDDLRGLFDLLRDQFDLNDCHDIAMELDPRTIIPGQIDTLAACGINRVSLGIQDFHEEVQQLVNRIQPFSLVESVCRDLRAAGIGAINFDLMYGLPLQTIDSTIDMAKLACQLSPQRVALFSYAHVPQFKKHQRAIEQAGIPDRFQRFAMDQAARDVLTGAGYVEVGIDHFARPEDAMVIACHNRTLKRNFQGYAVDEGEGLIGFGASSISCLSTGYFQNERQTELYQQMIIEQNLATRRGIELSPEDRLRGAIIEELMCFLDCDIGALCAKHEMPIDSMRSSFDRCVEMEKLGLIERHGNLVRLKTPHRMAIRLLCQAFDAYGGPSKLISTAA